MTSDAWLMTGILIAMFILLIWDRIPTWLVFIGTLTVTMTLGLASIDELLSGFANPGVITVAALYPIAAGMYATGAITIASNLIIGFPDSLHQAQVRILPPIAGVSAFLNNTPLVAMLIPVIKDISQRTGISSKKILMPLSFSSILGGASTIIGTSTNLIISGLIISAGIKEFNIFAPTLVALPTAVIAIIFLIFIGTRLLPKGESEYDDTSGRSYKAEFLILENSPLVGISIADAGLEGTQGYRLADVKSQPDKSKKDDHIKTSSTSSGIFHRLTRIWQRDKDQEVHDTDHEFSLDPNRILHAGDMITFITDNQSLPVLWSMIGIKPTIGIPLESKRYTHQLVETVIAPTHPAVGRQLSELPIRETPPYSAELVAISRNNKAPDGPLRSLRLEASDVGVLEVEDDFFYLTRDHREYTLSRPLDGYRIKRTSRAAIAGIITLVMVLLTAFNVMSMLNAALLGGLALLITGSMTPRIAWQSIEWDTIVVLGSAVGLSTAVIATGLSDAIAAALIAVGGNSPYIALLMVFIGSIILTNIITNVAAASIMFPVALALSASLNVSFTPFAIVLMLATSYAFINPAGYQTNLMVQEPGDYSFLDYAKLGIPLTILVGIVVMLLTPLIYPF